ncbi:hypothetical protein DQQ10_04215 [Pseudochryseolinea flava]|uniref:PE-PGRS family protein n=2 Tax=Pseudochryseolinea flava TaxID=2059302 RepID=A0A364YA58_9BACT|nr:hypothetical protein DQQ10_04215 [Pseudochryseolinea flava]
MTRVGLYIFIVAIAASCSDRPILDNPTDDFLPGKRLAELTNKKLDEVSGIASSIQHDGYLWAHNDSKNGTEVYLIDKQLRIAMTCKLVGVENRDWEDIAVGPGPEAGKSYVYVGEIGDNNAKYRFKRVFRFQEPENIQQGVVDIVDFDTIIFRLPAKKDAETLMIDPITKNLYIVSKREDPVFVYELQYPYSTKDTLHAKEVLSLPLTQIVSGDISADGKQVLLKNYEYVYYWNNPHGKPLLELLRERPWDVPYEEEAQGESITWARDGSGFYTLGEKSITMDTYLYFYQRKSSIVAKP